MAQNEMESISQVANVEVKVAQASILLRNSSHLSRQPFGAVIHKGEKGKRGGREEREKVAKGRKSVPKGTLNRDFSSKGRPKE